jgi:hypothetical protein
MYERRIAGVLMLEEGILGVPWQSTKEDVEAAHPGGVWRRKTEAHTVYFAYSVKGTGQLFGVERVVHLPTTFMFKTQDILTGLACWLQVPIEHTEQAFAMIRDACGPFDDSQCRQGNYWQQFLRPGFVVMAQKGIATSRIQRLNVVVGYHRSGPMSE